MLLTVVCTSQLLNMPDSSQTNASKFLFLVMTCFITYLASIGDTRHIYYLSLEQTHRAVKWSWVPHPWGIFPICYRKCICGNLDLENHGSQHFPGENGSYTVSSRPLLLSTQSAALLPSCNAILPGRYEPDLPAKCWSPNVQTHFNYLMSGKYSIFWFAHVVDR